jgi:hypothetical protein
MRQAERNGRHNAIQLLKTPGKQTASGEARPAKSTAGKSGKAAANVTHVKMFSATNSFTTAASSCGLAACVCV